MFAREMSAPIKRRAALTAVPVASEALAPAAEPAQPAPAKAPALSTGTFDIGSIAIFPAEPQVGPAGGNLSPATADRVRTREGGGSPLEAPVQQRMEGAFNRPFTDVRVHADAGAAALSNTLGASAFTLGSNIFLGQAAASAGAHHNDNLLAHELTHVVQQRGAAPGGPVTVDPVDAPAEREASAVAQEISTGNAAPAQLQAALPHNAVVQRVAAAPDAPAAPAGPVTPADIATQNAFNPMDLSHKLLRSIDQSHVKIAGFQEVTELSAESVSAGLLYGGRQPIYKRHVDFDETVTALNHLTAAQIQEVNKVYQAHEGRTLQDDLFGMGESGYPSDLTEDQSTQLHALLGGTVAGSAPSDQERLSAEANAGVATAAELHRLLHGDLEEEDIEHVMTALRHDGKTNAAVMTAYAKIGGDLRGDVFRMGPLAGQRAWKLLDGDVTGADALKVTFDKARIEGIDEQIKELLAEAQGDAGQRMGFVYGGQYKVKDLQKERKKLVEDIEKRAEQAGSEARASAPGDPTAAVQERMKQVLGDPNATAALVGGDDATLIRAMASDDPVPKAAAQLHKAAQSDDLKAEMLTTTLRGLRTEAEERAQRTFPKGDPRIESETKRLADDYFNRLRGAYNNLVSGDDKKFDELVDNLGDEGDQSVNIALMQSHGKLNDVAELIFALQGDRKDTASVERVLRNKNAQEVAQLKTEYQARTGRSLDHDLFGEGATHAGETNEANDSRQWDSEKGGIVKVDQGKASGTSRLNLEDYMQRPATEGGPQEAAYILDRAEREFAYTVDNRGATGAIRDAVGNEERDLLDESIGAVRRNFIEYCNLIGWYGASALTVANLALPASVSAEGAIHLVSPQLVQSPQAQQLIVQMRMARATIRGDRDAYEKATAALRAIFEAVAMFVIQAALTALLSPAAAALLEAVELGADAVEAGVMAARIAKFAANTTVNVASTIGANLAIHGSDYSVAMLKADLLGGLGGSIGGEAIEKMLGPVSKGLVEKLGPKASQELIGLAKTAGSVEGGAWAQGESGDLTLQNLVKTHLMGKAAGAITETTGKVTGLAPEPAGHGSATPTEPVAHQATEPAPQESHPGAAGTTEPAHTLPAAGSQEPAPPEQLPSGTHGEEPTETVSPTTTDSTETTPTAKARPGGSTPTEEEKTLVDTKPVEDETTASKPTPTDDEQTRVNWEPDVVHELPDGSAMWFDTPAEGRAAYNQAVREDSGREIAIYRNTKTGDVVLVQGKSESFKIDLQVEREALPGPAGTWELETHYHPINAETGVTRVPQRMPTASNGDFSILEHESLISGTRARTSRIDFVVEGDKRDYTEYGFHPGEAKPYRIDYPEAGTGKRIQLEFEKLADYEAWYRKSFPGYQADIPVPATSASGAPGGSAPAENEGGAPGATRNPSEPVESGGTGGPGGPGPDDPAGNDFDDEPTRVDLNPEEWPATDYNNREIDQMVRGNGVVKPPETMEELERSNSEAALARRILQNPNATPEQIIDAFEALAGRSIVEERAYQQRLNGKEPGTFRTLSSDDLRGMCNAGRDITAEALISAVGNSPHEIRIERIQASYLGIMVDGDAVMHGFDIVTLPNGMRYLIDPTFAQFANQGSSNLPLEASGTRPYTAGNMLDTAAGSAVARDLIRDGMIPITDEALRQYVIGLGADPQAADAAAARLLGGRATLVTEIVQNGQIERFVGREDGANSINTVSDRDAPPTDRIRDMIEALPPDHIFRPLLISLQRRLIALTPRMPELPD